MPDIVTLSKALTGGTLPLAATVASARVYEAFLSDDASRALMHGPTFAGNPLACAAANASLDLFEAEPRLAQVAAIEAQLEEGLAACRGLPGVRDVRVKGAIGVVELEREPQLEALRARFVRHGVWVRPFGDVVYLMPPLVIGAEDLAALTARDPRRTEAPAASRRRALAPRQRVWFGLCSALKRVPSGRMIAFRNQASGSSWRGAPIAVISWPTGTCSGRRPKRASMLAGAPSTNSIVFLLPFASVTSSVIAMCGLRNFTVSMTPWNSTSCCMS